MRKYLFAFTFQNGHIYKLKQIRTSNAHNSGSPIISIVSFILKEFPGLNISPSQVNHNIQLQQLEKYQQVPEFHPYFQIWTDYINFCVLNKRAACINDIFYIQLPLRAEFQKFLQAKTDSFEVIDDLNITMKLNPKSRLNSLFKIIVPINLKKVGIFLNTMCNLIKQPHEPRVNTTALFLGIFFSNQEWKVYQIPNKQQNKVPQVEEIKKLDCVLLSGSILSVLDSNPKIEQSINRLIQAYKQNQKLKIIGVCFGHQLLSKYFNGKVVKKQFKLGVEYVRINQKVVSQHPFLEPLKNRKEMAVFERHQDYVEQNPIGFSLLGDSKSCKYESLVSHDGRIFTTQFHPEYITYFIKHQDLRLSNQYEYQYDPISYSVNEDEEMRNLEDSKIWQECIRRLIDSDS